MGYNIGPKIGIDGEKEFRQSLRNINDEYKALEAETRAVAAAMENESDEQKKLESQQKQLIKQIDKQLDKRALLEDAIERAKKLYKEDSTEVTRLKGAMFDVDATISNLENDLADTSKRLENMAEGLEDVSQEAGQAEDAVLEFSDIVGANLVADLASDALQAMGDAVVDFAKGMPEAAAEVKAASSQFEQAFGDMESSARSALDSIAEETGITASRMQESFTGIYAFSKTMGADSSQALDLSSRALLAAADSAAYYDKSIEDVTQTLQSFLKGNYENDAALGISATETTRNTAANELYAKSFNELSESQKVDVLLSMVEAGNAASGALGQAAREADSWANVTGELEEAMYQLQATLGQPVLEALIPVIQQLTAGIQSMTEAADWQVLNNSINDFSSSLEASEKQMRDARTEVNSSAIMVQTYVKRLTELEQAGLDSAAAQEEYKQIVGEINGLIPDLNVTINEQTGRIDQSTAAILANVEAWKEQAYAQATQEQLTEKIRAYGEAEVALNDARAQRTVLDAELAAMEARLAELTGQSAQQSINQTNALLAGSDAMGNLAVDAARLNTEEGKLRNEIGKLKTEQERLDTEIAEGEKILGEYEGQIDATVEANAELQEATAETTEEIDLMSEAYAQAQEEARASIDSQIGLFDQLSTESSMSAREIIDNWNAQQQAFLNYEDNLRKAVDMGLDEALVRQLSDGSEQSMAILNELVNSTEVDVDQINAAFWGLSESKDNAAAAMAGLSSVVADATSGMYGEAYEAGRDTMLGLEQGIADNSWRVTSKMSWVADRAHAAYNEVLSIMSPSRVMKDSGRDTVLGAVVGVDENAKRLEESMANLAFSGRDAYVDAQLAAAEDFPMTYGYPAVSAGTTNTSTTNFGGVSFNIYQQPGEDAEALAYRVMDLIQTEIEQQEVAL